MAPARYAGLTIHTIIYSGMIQIHSELNLLCFHIKYSGDRSILQGIVLYCCNNEPVDYENTGLLNCTWPNRVSSKILRKMKNTCVDVNES